MFGAGFGDEDADNKPKTECYFDWQSGVPQLSDEMLLLPGSSIKGIISHRVAYHYNVLKGEKIGVNAAIALNTTVDINQVIEELFKKYDVNAMNYDSNSPQWQIIENEIKALTISDAGIWQDFENNLTTEVESKKNIIGPIGENNKAVEQLFGTAKNRNNNIKGLRGRVIIDDIYLRNDTAEYKVFNHVKIDRFTGGTVDGALFQEKAAQYKGQISVNIWVDGNAFNEDDDIKKAFENTLDDLKKGNLQLGGNSNKGHGVFTEKLLTN